MDWRRPPLWIYDGNREGCGKDTCADLTHVAYTGRSIICEPLFPEVPVEVEANICTTWGREMSSDDYSKRQSARDAEYQREYRAWIESLPEAERRRLEAKGLAAPCTARHGNGSARGDAADSPLMREGDDPAVLPDPDPEPDGETCDSESVWAALRRVLGEVLSHDNARLTAECIALVSGLSYTGSSMTEIAARHGITRSAVSKRCVELTELLDLKPSRAMRSLTARQRYRAARIRSTQSHEKSDPPAQP